MSTDTIKKLASESLPIFQVLKDLPPSPYRNKLLLLTAELIDQGEERHAKMLVGDFLIAAGMILGSYPNDEPGFMEEVHNILDNSKRAMEDLLERTRKLRNNSLN